jgi:hypothetical protein
MTASLSWNEIRNRAHLFVAEWKGELSESSESQSFWNDFFYVFGIKRRRVVIFQKKTARLSNVSRRGKIDAFWPGNILIEHKSYGEDLVSAAQQAEDYFSGLRDAELPRAILVCDFERFNFIDLDNNGQETQFKLEELPDKVELFGFLAGYEKQEIRSEFDLNLQATKLMAEIHEALEESGFRGHDLEVLLVRIMFCLFAEDAGIFEKDLFAEFIETRTHEDGNDLGSKLNTLFEVLDTPSENRQTTMDESFQDFPYVNGKLFSERLNSAFFTSNLRSKILVACEFKWSQISPAIFGSLFQSIMNPEKRRNLGAHYTSEANILRVIRPLFLDELRDELNRIKKLKTKTKRLKQFQEKLANLRFLDPACGCGNFLVIAYRELRLLEFEVLLELVSQGRLKDGVNIASQQTWDISFLVKVDVDQMSGIEIEEWPARIAETALWLVDHQMNRKLLELGRIFVRLPLRKAPNIHHGNALRLDWRDIIPQQDLSYILGNPPFIGSKFLSDSQRADMEIVFRYARGSGVLDYVTAWYVKAAQYISHTKIPCAFVSTNSITQGEQATILWQSLSKYGIHINFAHRAFAWDSEGTGVSKVHVVILGFGAFDVPNKLLFEYPDIHGDPHQIKVSKINSRLEQGPDINPINRNNPICSIPHARIGNQPIDGGYYLFTSTERADFLKIEPKAEPYFRRWVGSDEFINNIERWCLWLGGTPPNELKSMPQCLNLIEKVRRYRLGELPAKGKPDTPKNRKRRPQTVRLADTPTRFYVETIPTTKYLVIPEVSSERRRYIPIGFVEPDILCSNLVKIIQDTTLYHFGILSSLMHMIWVRRIAGRLKSDYRYSTKLVYNNFPWPSDVSETKKQAISNAADLVLNTRREYSECSLADLYDPRTMPAELLNAHRNLDRAVDQCYRKQVFLSDADRLDYLLNLYAERTSMDV